jgi:hypothetical protein
MEQLILEEMTLFDNNVNKIVPQKLAKPKIL